MPPIEWKILEYQEKSRGADWFWAVGIIAAAIAMSAIILGNILFAVFIIVAGVTLVLQVLRKPRPISVKIGENGITIEKTLYPYYSLDAFWVEEEDDNLILKSKKALVPYIIVPIGSIDKNRLHEYLSTFLEEKEMHESLSQKIMEYLGF